MNVYRVKRTSTMTLDVTADSPEHAEEIAAEQCQDVGRWRIEEDLIECLGVADRLDSPALKEPWEQTGALTFERYMESGTLRVGRWPGSEDNWYAQIFWPEDQGAHLRWEQHHCKSLTDAAQVAINQYLADIASEIDTLRDEMNELLGTEGLI